jgi:hypothetical protein
MTPFYTVITDSAKFGKYTFENDHIAKPLDEQLRLIADLVWTEQWDEVSACYKLDPDAGTCVDAMAELAEALDAQSKRLEQEPGDEACAIIRRVLNREPWFPPSDEDEGEPDPRRYNEWARQQTSWGA